MKNEKSLQSAVRRLQTFFQGVPAAGIIELMIEGNIIIFYISAFPGAADEHVGNQFFFIHKGFNIA